MKARLFLFTACLLLALQLYPRAPAAQYYPICAQFSDGSSLDCGFSTLQMCEASVTGVGGLCLNNPAGPPPPQLTSGPLQLPDVPQAHQLPSPQQQAQQQSCNPLIDGTYCATQGGPINPPSMPRIQSMASDLGIGGSDPPATLGAITFSGNSTCIGLFRRYSCGG